MSAASRGSRARARQNNAAAMKAAEAATKSDQTDTPPTETMDLDLPDPSMQLLAEAAQNQARAPEHNEIKDEEDDSRSSSLSDIDDHGATEGSELPENESAASEDEEGEEEDTEAETERLEPTPSKTRSQRKVLLNAVLEDNASSVAAQEELDNEAEEDLEEKAEEEGTEQAEEGEGSDMSSAEESEQDPPELRSKKRKRGEDDETAKALKKVSLGLVDHAASQSKEVEDDETPEPTAPGTALEEVDASREDSPAEDVGANATAEVEEPAESNVEDADDAAQEPDASSIAKTEEELRNKKAALDKLSDIEKDFALLRDKLFADRSTQLAEELATIQSDVPTHPEYLAMVEAIEQLRNERIEQAKTVYRFKLQALQKKATTTRAAAQSQYMQSIRELRDDALESASAEWYQIQRERRNFDADKEPALNHFAGERSQWVAAQTAYNTEVSVLSGVAKYVGFPAAPEIRGATTAEVEEDLKRMGISRNSAPTPTAAPISQMGRAKPAAEEQFIAETAWANPNHQQSQYLTNVHRQASNTFRPGSPMNTPVAQKQTGDPVPNGSASTIPALPSSSLAPTPMSMDINATAKNAQRLGTLETPSKPPDRGESKQVAAVADDPQDALQATHTTANENGVDASSEVMTKAKTSPPTQPAPALKDSISGQLDGPSNLPPGVEVGGG